MEESLEIAPGFRVSLEDTLVTLRLREAKATYTVREVLAIANILRWFVEQEAGVVKATKEGKRRVMPT